MARIRIGEFVVDPESNEVVCPGGSEIRVEPKVMAVLCALAKRPGQVVTREQLIDEIWGVEHGADERLTRTVSTLRKVFNGAQESQRYIETIPKRGYKLVAPVSGIDPERVPAPGTASTGDTEPSRAAPGDDVQASRSSQMRRGNGDGQASYHSLANESLLAGSGNSDPGAAPSPPDAFQARHADADSNSKGATVSDEATAKSVPQPPASHRAGRLISRPMLLTGIAAGAALLITAISFLIGSDAFKPSVGVTRNLVSVKPFQVISKEHDNSELRAFADSLRTNISTYLSTFNVNVVTSGSVDEQGTPEFELDGVVETDGDNYRVTPNLRYAGSNISLWSRSYTRAANEASAFRDQIATNIAMVVGTSLAYRKTESGMSNRTFRAWLRLFDVGANVKDMAETLSNLVNYSEEVLKSAPKSAHAKSMHAFILMTDYNRSGKAASKEKARELAEQVLKADPENPAARTVLVGTMPWAGNWAKVERELERALAHSYPDPASSRRFWVAIGSYGWLLRNLGRIKDAKDHLENSLVTDRFLFMQRMAFAQLLAFAYGQIDRSEKQLDFVMRLWPDVTLPRINQFFIHLYVGDPVLALAYLENEASGPFQFSTEQRACLAAFAKDRLSASTDVPAVASACGRASTGRRMLMFAYLGDLDRAYSAAEEFTRPYFWANVFVHRSMRPFRRDPRFWPLAHKWGLVDYWLETDKWPDFCKEEDLPFDCKEKALAVAKQNATRR